MIKTVLYGGSFDPVHNAHVDIINNLCGRFDRVIVVPCKTSPFKSGTSGSAAQRVDMLKLALSGSSAEISMFELESTQPSYSYITAEHFTSSGTELYFAIGSEMLPELRMWENFERLSKLVKFYVIPRPDFPIGSLDCYRDIDLTVADFGGLDGSSSEVKISVAMGNPEMFLPQSVAGYVSGHGLYRDYDYVNGLYAKYNMKPKRVRHSFSAALCGVNLAKRAGVDLNKAVTALLLHDIGKNVTADEAAELGLKLPDEICEMPKGVRHAIIGAEILSQLEGISDQGIIGAVRWHTTGKADMTMLEIVVFLADYIEPLRAFEGVGELREAVSIDIMHGLREALRRMTEHIEKEKLYHTTSEAHEFYTETRKETGFSTLKYTPAGAAPQRRTK